MIQPTASGPRRIPELDGLRGIAALLVILRHYYVCVPSSPDLPLLGFLQRLFTLSYCGVDLFFVLSGFFIGGILLDHREAPNLYGVFYRRRFFRIFPVYALLLVSFQVGRTIPGLNTLNFSTYFDSPVPLWSYWVFLQNIAMSMMRDPGSYWLAPTWSLGIEEQFYLIMPFLVRILDRRGLAWLCIGAAVLCPLLRLLVWQRSANALAAIYLMPLRADSLLWGVLCALVLRHGAGFSWLRAHRGWVLVTAILLGSLTAILSVQEQAATSPIMLGAGYSVVGLLSAGCLLLALLYPGTAPVRFLAWRPLTQVGVISYFVYLAHLPVWYVAHWLLRGRPPSHATLSGCAVTLSALGLTFLLGWLSWRYMESPLLALGKRTGYRSS